MALAHLDTCGEETLSLRLPPQSVHGASLNRAGTALARRVGRLIAADCAKCGYGPAHIFTRWARRAVPPRSLT
jgi:hypothetical protein